MLVFLSVDLVICFCPSLTVYFFVVTSAGSGFVFLVLSKRLAGKSIP